jgi:hypothetical protein
MLANARYPAGLVIIGKARQVPRGIGPARHKQRVFRDSLQVRWSPSSSRGNIDVEEAMRGYSGWRRNDGRPSSS